MKSNSSTARYVIGVAAPYRLDLTVSALRRLSTNKVDILTADGHYVRALIGFERPVVVRVTQEQPDALAVTVDGSASDHKPTLAVVRRMLGVDRELTHFNRGAKNISWLRPLAEAMRGVKPPRYPTPGGAVRRPPLSRGRVEVACRGAHERTLLTVPFAWAKLR